MKNLGNSCYVNSVLQLLWTLPQLQERYASAADKIFESAPSDLAQDFITQFAKVGVALAGEPHKSGACQNGNDTALQVTPVAFKTLVGKGHPEFSSNRQQVSVTRVLTELFHVEHLSSLVKTIQSS